MDQQNNIKNEVKLVTYPELYLIMFPYMRGWSWAEDALRDLWLLGAPVPQDRCPHNQPCKAYPRCDHIRRILLPQQFANWWKEVSERMSVDLSVQAMLEKLD